jgi:hypothetical protein
MADNTTAFAIPLHQVPGKRKDKTGAARAKAYRQRKRQEFKVATAAEAEPPSEGLMPPDSMSADGAIAEPSKVPPPVTPGERSEKDFTWNIGMTRADLLTVAPSRHYLAPVLLTTAALALSAVGIAINGWFARSLGSSDVAGWLFMAVGTPVSGQPR